MNEINYEEISTFLRDDLRLKTYPVAVKFLKDKSDFPLKTRRPSRLLRKRITICQAVTMARNYRWTVGLTKDDLICVPAMIAFGFSGAEDPASSLVRLVCGVNYHENEEMARGELDSIYRLENDEFEAVVLAPLAKGLYEPDTVVIYGNPAQVMRMVQAWVYRTGRRLSGEFGGKLECCEYMIAPFRTEAARPVIPGLGDRIFSMTQDDEMAFALPGKGLGDLVTGLKEAGSRIGARYPVTHYQNFEPEFPKIYQDLGKELGIT